MLPLVNTVRECTVTGSSCCDCTGRRRSSFPSRAVRLTTPRDDVKTDSSSNRPLLLPCPGSGDYSFVVTSSIVDSYFCPRLSGRPLSTPRPGTTIVGRTDLLKRRMCMRISTLVPRPSADAHQHGRGSNSAVGRVLPALRRLSNVCRRGASCRHGEASQPYPHPHVVIMSERGSACWPVSPGLTRGHRWRLDRRSCLDKTLQLATLRLTWRTS